MASPGCSSLYHARVTCGFVATIYDASMNRKPTERQNERQRTREGGRYSRMEHCEDCDKAIRGGAYFSAPDCNETGRGVVLCAPCCHKHEERFYGFRVERTSATGLDVDEPWVTTCTKHATMTGSRTRDLAYAAGYSTDEFCDACRESR